jgi:crossover junction endodeoxyribonuclease RuvC
VTVILGVDPGMTGALVALDTELQTLVIQDMPAVQVETSTKKKRLEILDAAVARFIEDVAPDHAFLELVGAAPGQGVVSMFRFGMAYGVIRGVLAGLKVPVDLVTPNEWKRSTRCPQGDNGSQVRASQLYPQFASHFSRAKDHGRADATLIAYFGSSKFK